MKFLPSRKNKGGLHDSLIRKYYFCGVNICRSGIDARKRAMSSPLTQPGQEFPARRDKRQADDRTGVWDITIDNEDPLHK